MDEKDLEIEELVEKKITVPNTIFNKKKKESNKDVVSRTEVIVKELHDQGLIQFVEGNEEVQEKVMLQVAKSIDTELSKINSKGTKEAQNEAYDANSESCKNYGVDTAVEQWKIKMMRIGSGIWFVIYFIIASVSITPVSVFTRGLNTFIKRMWISMIFAILVWLLITVGIPLLIKLT
ncbi:MAG: hypothetical protein PF487_05775 [Bacteroidales bacterium]|jgi:hypothetical protein|nr:hypothetical protein [Bacteroidales bacterium]